MGEEMSCRKDVVEVEMMAFDAAAPALEDEG